MTAGAGRHHSGLELGIAYVAVFIDLIVYRTETVIVACFSLFTVYYYLLFRFHKSELHCCLLMIWTRSLFILIDNDESMMQVVISFVYSVFSFVCRLSFNKH